MSGEGEKGHGDSKYRPDEIGYWSEVKLQIVRDYASAYTTIMAKQRQPFEYWYVDAFSGAGLHLEKYTGKPVLGSPLNALGLEHPFSHYLFIDLHGGKIQALKKHARSYPCFDRADFEQGDCNEILKRKVFDQLKWSD
ncbi:MAG: three-Cys-motif partner protein TcmP, partial [candidate division Zixibacteria bacterium]|nr:three-Cys-motif partner protein TcmP [candidate division Zixibacteria bacterium]